jgi:hypothetical protein
VVATWNHPVTPSRTLGAMLPDFSSMCRAPLAPQTDPDIERGIALHHATDAVFHQAPSVTHWFRLAGERLRRRGVRTGPMRAAAHVGVELAIDGALLADADSRAYFFDALRSDAAIHWRDEDGATRVTALRERLHNLGPPNDLLTGHGIAQRLDRALSGRPRLAIGPDEYPAIVEVMAELAPGIAAATPAILNQVREQLQRRSAL